MRNARKLGEYIEKTDINWISPRRPGKLLLVLDLDHTLLDFTKARKGNLRQICFSSAFDLILFSLLMLCLYQNRFVGERHGHDEARHG